MRSRKLSLYCLALLIGSGAQARGVSPYLPLNLSPEIERDVERVLILSGKPTLTRPIPAALVLDALPAACKVDTNLCERVRRYLARYMEPAAITHVSAEAASTSGTPQAIPNRHGLSADASWAVSAVGHVQLNDYLLVNGGLNADTDATRVAGSFMSLGFDFAQLDIGYRDHWLSPMTDSSMLIGTQAATMPSVTLSNYAPITGLGLRYELFLARMPVSDNIAYQGGTTSGNPRLAGIHVGIEPVAGWSLSGNRIMQFGGGARGGTGVSDFINALLKPHDTDNTSATLSSDQQFGNQAAAWTSRMVFPGRTPFAVYFEYAGEDSSYSGNYRLGNSALSLGLDFPKLFENFDLTYEASEWQNGWYVHGVYGDGLTNDGHVIGHWFGDNRIRGDAVGGQSHMLRLGWEPTRGGVAEFRYRTLTNETYSGVSYARAHDFTLRYSSSWRSVVIGGEVNAGRDVFGDKYSRIAAFARFGGADVNGQSAGYETESDSREENNDGVDYFVDIGASASKVRTYLEDGNDPFTTALSYAPHFGLGARRAVSERGDLGARIELDRIESHLLIAVRALDYRHRFGSHVAMTAFAGAARYDLATPAFGYYFGAGVQWRNLTKNLDLNLDVRYGDKIARDKFSAIPSDPQIQDDPQIPNSRPDQFYDLMGATLYLSYRL